MCGGGIHTSSGSMASSSDRFRIKKKKSGYLDGYSGVSLALVVVQVVVQVVKVVVQVVVQGVCPRTGTWDRPVQ